MDWYALFKFLHIASAILWVGGGFVLVLLGIAAQRDRDEQIRVVKQVAFLAPRLFAPVSGAALIFGGIAAWLFSYFGELWIWIGLVGFAATALTGNFLLRPRAERIEKLVAAEGYSKAAEETARSLLTIAKFDYAMLFTIVADMVFKPTVSDWPLLLVMVLVIAGSAALFLGPILRKQPAVGVPG